MTSPPPPPYNADMSAPQTNGSEGDEVRLPPVLGIRPGVYLAALYALAVALVLFLVLVYPGLASPGALVILKTDPEGAALRVDGVYAGTSADRIFVSKGRHTLELGLPGFTPQRIECDIPGRVFASALFPRRFPLEARLRAEDPVAAFAAAAGDYAAWTFGGEPVAAWQVPLSLSEGAYRLGPAALPGTSEGGAVREIIAASARFATTRGALRDLLRAGFLADNGGLSPSPLTFAQSAAAFARFVSDNPGSALWLSETLPPESSALIAASSWYEKQRAFAATAGASRSIGSGGAPPLERISLGGLSFTALPGFLAATEQVSVRAFGEFLAANPQWREDQKEILEEQELAAPGYLDGEGYTEGIASVSWFAAGAYCEWFSLGLPPALAGWEVRLPTEAEWEYMAKSGIVDPGKSWEWCGDPFSPLPFLDAPEKGIRAVSSPERPVRSGSRIETRASLPPEFCSPFVSFRPVIAPAPPSARAAD